MNSRYPADPAPVTATIEQTDAGTATAQIMDAGAATSNPDPVYPTHTPYPVGDDAAEPLALLHTVPEGYKVVVTDVEAIRAQYRPWPERKNGRLEVTTVASFLSYVRKHTDVTRLDAPRNLDGDPVTDTDPPADRDGEHVEVWVHNDRVTAVLNAHETSLAGWGDHTVDLRLIHSPEWKEWVGTSGRKLMPQAEFAEWLEDQADDVAEPDKASLIEIARSLEAHTKSTFKSRYRTKDGQIGLRYEEDTQARAGTNGDVEIPDRFTLALRVFLGQEPVLVTARLRFRIQPGGLTIGYVIHRPGDVIRAEVERIADTIDEGVAPGTLVLDART